MNFFKKIERAFNHSDITLIHPKTQTERQTDARVIMGKARNRYLDVIDTESRIIRQNQQDKLSEGENEGSRLRIKKAYYGITLIDEIEKTMDVNHTEHALFEAQNKLTRSLVILKRIENKSPKYKGKKFENILERYLKKTEDNEAAIQQMFENLGDMDKYVSNDLVDRIVSGDELDGMIRRNEGIMVDPEEFMGNLDNFRFEETEYDPSELENF